MRRFIRHPTDIPLTYKVLDSNKHKKPMKDISQGGLCFRAEHAISANAVIQIEISACNPVFSAEGTVAWCHSGEEGFEVGVAFDDDISNFNLRMVEQICYINHYKNYIWEKEGRNLSSEEAASEWIQKYAAVFPA